MLYFISQIMIYVGNQAKNPANFNIWYSLNYKFDCVSLSRLELDTSTLVTVPVNFTKTRARDI